MLWHDAAKESFDHDGHMPAGLQKAFEGSLLDFFPGFDTAWLLEGGVLRRHRRRRGPAAWEHADPVRGPALSLLIFGS